MNGSRLGQAVVVSTPPHHQQSVNLFTSLTTSAAAVASNEQQQLPHYHQSRNGHNHSHSHSHNHSHHHHHHAPSSHLHLHPSSQNLVYKHRVQQQQQHGAVALAATQTLLNNQPQQYLSSQEPSMGLASTTTAPRQQLVNVITNGYGLTCGPTSVLASSVELASVDCRSAFSSPEQQQQQQLQPDQLMQLDIDEQQQQQQAYASQQPTKLFPLDAIDMQPQQDLSTRLCAVAVGPEVYNLAGGTQLHQQQRMVATPGAIVCAPQQRQFGRARVSSISSPIAISAASAVHQSGASQTTRRSSPFAIARSTSFSASTRPQTSELSAFAYGGLQQQQHHQQRQQQFVTGCSEQHHLVAPSTQCYQPVQAVSPASSISSVSPLAAPVSPRQQQQQQQQMHLGMQSPLSSYASSQQSSSPDCGQVYLGAGYQHQSGASMSPSDALNLGINLEQYISKRNERERSRVRNVNDAFDNLKNSLPLEMERLTKRMSKVEILRTAISYIRNLEDVLGYKQQQQKQEQHD